MGVLGFLKRLIIGKPRWQGTPEAFLAFVQYLQQINNPIYSAQEVWQLGEIMQKVMHVRLAPYADFRDLMQNGVPDFSMVAKVDQKYQEIRERVELKQAIYGEQVDLGEDDIMNSSEREAILAREFVKDLSKYVEFNDEDKQKLDKL